MKYQKQMLFILAGLLILGGLMFSGCQKLSLEGPLKTNIAPRLFWADVPVEELHTQSPNLRWYSTDIDGLVLDYQYSVLLTTTVDSLGGADAVATQPPTDTRWSIVHKDSASIPLYAAENPDSALSQFVFLRAMDDDSAFSTIIYRQLWRQNHAPTNYLVLPEEAQWCLPETTATWKGIKVAWVGKDSVDIEGLQPDFQWDIRIYGPFTSSGLADTLSEHLYRRLTDRESGDIWTLQKQAALTNLETGWYNIYARCRDDAYVPAIPAVGLIEVYEPRWIRYNDSKPILLANHSWYATGQFSGGELTQAYSDSVKQFYIRLIEAAGFTSADYDWVDYSVGNSELSVPKTALYNHRLVIAIDTDKSRAFMAGSIDQEGAYAQYLDVGGNLWIIGRRSFIGNADIGRVEFGANSISHPLPYPYFNLSAVFSSEIGNYANAEFAGAFSMVPELPDLVVDSLRTMQADWRDPRPPNPEYHYITVPGVDFIIRLDDSETLYRFVSSTPDTSRFHNFPVAVRYDRGTFKTSYFSFPLYFIQEDRAAAVTREMINWFFED